MLGNQSTSLTSKKKKKKKKKEKIQRNKKYIKSSLKSLSVNVFSPHDAGVACSGCCQIRLSQLSEIKLQKQKTFWYIKEMRNILTSNQKVAHFLGVPYWCSKQTD